MSITVVTAEDATFITLEGVTNVVRLSSTVVGAPGLSAYEIAVQEGFVGTEQEWLDSLAANSAVDVTNMTYAGGLLTGYTIAGEDYVVTYNGDSMVSTIVGGGKTVTYTYNGDGQVSSITVS